MKNAFLNLSLALALLIPASLRADSNKYDEPDRDGRGGVYTMDNSPGGNNVWAFGRREDGSLSSPRLFATGGLGTGSGLGNQGSVILSPDGRWLFVCNAGSDEISVFKVTPHGLTLADKVQSQGQRPISLALHRNLLYVLNAGGAIPNGADNIAGFLFVHGELLPLPEATHALSASNTGPAQVAFTRDGDYLVVTEKGTALIDVFSLSCDGAVTGMKSFSSPAPPPFGFDTGAFDRIFVTQAAGGAGNPGASSVSSYEITPDGDLQVISDSVATRQTAACWLVLTRNEKFAYTANTPNDSISSFRVGRDGQLELLNSVAASTGTGSGPVDMALSVNNRFLYSLNPGNGTIGSFRLNAKTGSLEPVAAGGTIPKSANGLAAQ